MLSRAVKLCVLTDFPRARLFFFLVDHKTFCRAGRLLDRGRYKEIPSTHDNFLQQHAQRNATQRTARVECAGDMPYHVQKVCRADTKFF